MAAVLKDSDAYQHIDPGLVGNQQRVLVSELSGRGNVLSKAREFGLELDRDDPETRRLVQHLKELEHRGYSYEAADASFELLLRRLRPDYTAPWRVVDFTTMVRPWKRDSDPARPGSPAARLSTLRRRLRRPARNRRRPATARPPDAPATGPARARC